jgi:hypothetical protein
LMNTISARFERFVGCDQEDGHELE